MVAADGLRDVVTLCRRLDRADLAGRLGVAINRAERPEVVVLVVGEYKQGKSSLVNALVGADVCPVDDLVATAVPTLCHHGELAVVVHRREEDARHTAAFEALPHLVTEANDDTGIARVDVALESPLLASGLVLIDTPGVGGLAPGVAATIGALVPHADGVLVVSGATGELTSSELDLLTRVRAACPVVALCVTKIDLVPAWRQVVARDAERLDAAGLDVAVVSVSPFLHRVAERSGDPGLAADSGIPDLIDGLAAEVQAGARDRARVAAAAEAVAVLGQLDAMLAVEQAALVSPEEADRLRAAAGELTQRLEHLRAAGARWSQVLADALTDTANEATYELRRGHRELLRTLDARMDASSSPEQWEQITGEVRGEVAELLARVEQTLAGGVARAADAVGALVVDELALETLALGLAVDIDAVTADLRSAPLADQGLSKKAASGVGNVVGALRGVQGGMMLLGTLVTLLPSAAVVSLASPVALGIALAFGGKSVADQRKRKLAEGRQKVRLQLRALLDEVVFHAGNELASVQRQVQRDMRERVRGRLFELQQTAAASYAAAVDALEHAGADQARRDTIAATRAEVAALRDRLA